MACVGAVKPVASLKITAVCHDACIMVGPRKRKRSVALSVLDDYICIKYYMSGGGGPSRSTCGLRRLLPEACRALAGGSLDAAWRTRKSQGAIPGQGSPRKLRLEGDITCCGAPNSRRLTTRSVRIGGLNDPMIGRGIQVIHRESPRVHRRAGARHNQQQSKACPDISPRRFIERTSTCYLESGGRTPS